MELDQIANVLLRDIATRSEPWRLWKVALEGESAELLETGDRLWLAVGGEVIEGAALPQEARETPLQAARRLWDGHIKERHAAKRLRDEVWCVLLLRRLQASTSVALCLTEVDELLKELQARGLVDTMGRVLDER